MSAPDESTKLAKVYRHLHAEIVRGRFLEGERLPTEEQLSREFGYSRTTVAKAIRLLARNGLVERRRRSGTVVRSSSSATRLLGALICGAAQADASSSIFVPLSRELAHELELSGFALSVVDPLAHASTLEQIRARHEQAVRQFIDSQVAAVLLVPYELIPGEDLSLSAPAAHALSEAGIPVVLADRDICRYPSRSNFDLVGIDHRRAGAVATEHLLSRGVRRVDFLASAQFGWAQEARISGYREALRDAGLDSPESCIHHGHLADPDYLQPILSNPDIRAIVAVNDAFAAVILRAALDLGRKIPDDLLLVGFDDLPSSQHLPVPLTTIRQPGDELGALAGRALLHRMRYPSRKTLDIHPAFELIVRQSSSP